ncbi:MAG: putative toxin-antitoxin system toxin component, PIN family [Candidatus Solibacter sp.]|nr:putative toxin-antitoxin system toxin component, PIN family [Candidatus Solibacter sp.]
MLTVTLDSNIYVSALGFGGLPMRILQMAMDGDIRIASSPFIQGDVLRILRVKLRWDEDRVNAAGILIVSLTVPASGSLLGKVDAVRDDPTDNRVLECALESGSQLVITGDKHLLRIGEYAGVGIIRAADFLQRSGERVG